MVVYHLLNVIPLMGDLLFYFLLPQGSQGAVPTVGDMVYVPKLGRNVKVIEVKSSKKEVTVQSGLLQVKVKFKEIQWPGLVQA